jgi:hypothetical protein
MEDLSSKEHVSCYRNLCEHLGSELSTRDERAILDGLRLNREADAMYALDTATLVDEFFCFMGELGLFPILESIHPEGQQRKMIDLLPMLLLYILKTLSGISGLDALPELLFANQGMMRLVGFNGKMLKDGACRRGEHARKGKKRSIPLCPDTIRKNLVRICEEDIIDFFNSVVSALAKFGVYARKVSAYVDASPIVTSAKAKDAGRITQHKKVTTNKGEVREFEVSVYGWKFTSLWDAKSGLPLAVTVGKIQEGDGGFLLKTIRQAQKNLEGSGSRLEEVGVDGGYLDGADLYELDQMGLRWIIRGKTTQLAVREAVELAKVGRGLPVEEREETVKRGSGRNALEEKVDTRVVGVPGLESFATYGPPGLSPSASNRRNFVGNTVNAVVVERWKGKTPKEAEVYLTNASVDKPLQIADWYDERSEIENRHHREVKQSCHLEHLLQKSEAGVYVHVYLVLATYALSRAFRTWRWKEEDSESKGRGSSLESFRRKVHAENFNLVIVFDGPHYGIFDLADLAAVLSGVGLREQTVTRTWEELYLKYTGQPP